MPHADSAMIPAGLDKVAFWAHVHEQLRHLLAGQRDWVCTNLANASSLIYNSLYACPEFGSGERMVNWCGFYLHPTLFPAPRFSAPAAAPPAPERLLLGPFCGKPACQLIHVAPGRARGVCADAYVHRRTVLVPDVDAYPGHIACDGETKSEVVCPLLLRVPAAAGAEAEAEAEAEAGAERALGVLDLDCLALGGFDERDRDGLERIAQLVVDACDW
ncbi:GAF domain nucleotide-binding protein [Epithele typhae]|uniref:GAF domain nucleotide-binding protein n=1 Tax=Epithele typhae TaxID=378194 RepID=UPI002007CBA5|nr:GAF domain nucleotide-binding protein [Epithele typhae]KAH9929552.1 GAF domain nucleotide-binding protein [Epithele typhae]